MLLEGVPIDWAHWVRASEGRVRVSDWEVRLFPLKAKASRRSAS